MAVILTEDCDNFTDAPWVTAGSPTISASGHTGNGFSLPSGSVNTVSYNIPAGQQTDTLGFSYWWRTAAFATSVPMISFRSDAGATSHFEFRYTTTAAAAVRSPSTVLTSGNHGMVVNTWYLIEGFVTLHDTNGAYSIKVNGTVITSGTNADTRNAGTKTVFDQIRFHSAGSAGPFLLDDITLMNSSSTTPTVKVYNGASFVDGPTKVYNGSAFVDAVAVKTWNGTSFV